MFSTSDLHVYLRQSAFLHHFSTSVRTQATVVHNGCMRLVLASASPARRATLSAAGITPIVRVSTVDEDALLASLPGGRALSGGTTTPADEVAPSRPPMLRRMRGAQARRRRVPAGEPVLVVGCDSMLEIGGQMLGKPHTPEVARERIAGHASHDRDPVDRPFGGDPGPTALAGGTRAPHAGRNGGSNAR